MRDIADAPAARRALIVQSGAAPHAIAAARSLAECGWSVGVAAAEGPPPRSRAIDRHHVVPMPELAARAFVDAVAGLVDVHRYDVVFGVDDIEVMLLSAFRSQLGCVVPYAPHANVVRAIDKLELSRAAEAVGLWVPDTRPASPSALRTLAGPVVVKARLHWAPTNGHVAPRHLLAATCATRDDAARCVEAMRRAGGEPLLQEVVEGDLEAITTVVDRQGQPLACVQQRSPRLSARRTSCRAETVPVQPRLRERIVALLADLGWVGLANLQFLRPPGGEPHLIDLNGRFYGSYALAAASGVNLADLWARVALGEPADRVPDGRPGVRFQALFEDLGRARKERRGGLLRDIAGSLAYAPGAVHSRASLADPMPALQQVARRLSPGRSG